MLELYKWFIIKEKNIYQKLNTMRTAQKLFIGLFWTPKAKIDSIRNRIGDFKNDKNIEGPSINERVEEGLPPPSSFARNEFLDTF